MVGSGKKSKDKKLADDREDPTIEPEGEEPSSDKDLEPDRSDSDTDLVAEMSDSAVEPLKARNSSTSETAKPRELSLGELDATRMYLSEIGYSSLLTAEEEVYYARLSLKGDESARKQMIVSNLRLPFRIEGQSVTVDFTRSGVARQIGPRLKQANAPMAATDKSFTMALAATRPGRAITMDMLNHW